MGTAALRLLFRLQALQLHCPSAPRVHDAVVEARTAALPEFDAFRLQAVAAPVGRARRLGVADGGGHGS
jgi:hypothetical protein